jgi:hypothetical protein
VLHTFTVTQLSLLKINLKQSCRILIHRFHTPDVVNNAIAEHTKAQAPAYCKESIDAGSLCTRHKVHNDRSEVGPGHSSTIQTIRECIISPKSEYRAAKGNFYQFRIIAEEKYRRPLVFTILR